MAMLLVVRFRSMRLRRVEGQKHRLFEVREKEQCLAYFSKEKDGNFFLYFKLVKLVIQIMQRYHTRSQEPW